uniref:Uncharacterized protein n=1 Tax=Arcella intermedia TaxID=1963864 RepID=A0A6B2LMI4_9EUKA
MEDLDFDHGLHGGALNNNVERVRSLLSKGANPNEVDKAGYTPLLYSSRNGNVEITNLLLQARANPNATTGALKTTALHRACAMGHTQVVVSLLGNQADATLQDSDGETALHRAVKKGNPEIVSLILKKSPSAAQISDNVGNLPIQLTDNPQILQLLNI